MIKAIFGGERKGNRSGSLRIASGKQVEITAELEPEVEERAMMKLLPRVVLVCVVCAHLVWADDGGLSFMNYFVGTWEGKAEGEPGKGDATREYQWVLRKKFVQAKHKGVYPPQPKNAKGETHEDMSMFSYDKGRKKIVLRQFHVEGFVNQYVAEVPAAGAKTLVFETEAIENIPAGWRARETYTIEDANHFTERFELAEPGKEFAVYSQTKFERKSPRR